VLFTRTFWNDTAERCLRTFAQALAAVLLATGTGLITTDWATSTSTAGMAAVLALLTAIGGETIGAGDPGNASWRRTKNTMT
jgi:hypothetical protein